VDSHKFPRCHEPNETHEHILTCPHIGAHKNQYDLVHPMLYKIVQNNLCPVQHVFAKCVRAWLESPETLPKPDVSSVPESQRDLLIKVLEDQERIGWRFGMQGYLSRHWGLAVSANTHLKEDNNKGDAWSRKAILQLWEFSREMWEHRNAVLHDMQLEASRRIQDADLNDAITKLYEKIDTYAAQDRWYFDIPLVLRLKKSLHH